MDVLWHSNLAPLVALNVIQERKKSKLPDPSQLKKGTEYKCLQNHFFRTTFLEKWLQIKRLTIAPSPLPPISDDPGLYCASFSCLRALRFMQTKERPA